MTQAVEEVINDLAKMVHEQGNNIEKVETNVATSSVTFAARGFLAKNLQASKRSATVRNCVRKLCKWSLTAAARASTRTLSSADCLVVFSFGTYKK